MEEFSILEVLPNDNQVVLVNILGWSNYFVNATFISETQMFIISESGLKVHASLIGYWKEV